MLKLIGSKCGLSDFKTGSPIISLSWMVLHDFRLISSQLIMLLHARVESSIIKVLIFRQWRFL